MKYGDIVCSVEGLPINVHCISTSYTITCPSSVIFPANILFLITRPVKVQLSSKSDIKLESKIFDSVKYVNTSITFPCLISRLDNVSS